MSRAAACLLLALAACAHAPPAPEASAARVIEDAALGFRLTLPPSQRWTVDAAGAMASDAGVQARVGLELLGAPGEASACLEAARPALAAKVDVSTGRPHAEVSHRAKSPAGAPLATHWAFWPRGADCLVLEVDGPPDAADAAYDWIAGSFSVQPLAPPAQRRADLEGAVSLLGHGKYSPALDRFELLARETPGAALPEYGALMSGYALGEPAYRRALPHGEAALGIQGDAALTAEQRRRALETVALIELTLGEADKATSPLAELVVREPGYAPGHYNYACALALRGDPDAAFGQLAEALALEPRLAEHARTDGDLKSLVGARLDAMLDEAARRPPPPSSSEDDAGDGAEPD